MLERGEHHHHPVFCFASRSAPAAAAPPAAGGEGVGPPPPPPNLTSNRRLQQTQAQVDEVSSAFASTRVGLWGAERDALPSDGVEPPNQSLLAGQSAELVSFHPTPAGLNLFWSLGGSGGPGKDFLAVPCPCFGDETNFACAPRAGICVLLLSNHA